MGRGPRKPEGAGVRKTKAQGGRGGSRQKPADGGAENSPPEDRELIAANVKGFGVESIVRTLENTLSKILAMTT